jgi:CubicO group peptidase (beta-lactamase class C family)
MKPALFALALSLQAANFDAAVAAGEKMPRLHSLLVSQRGQLTLEKYFHGTRPTSFANTKSAAKSVISALVGIAIEKKLIAGPQTPIKNFFPELSKDKQQITIEDLLSMRSGLTETNRAYGAWVMSPNWVRYLLSKPAQFAPGEQMNYNTGNTHLLSAILTKASGISTFQFAQTNLAAPLGITLIPWQQDPQGIYFGGNNMLMTPRQMLRFGELYLHRGQWEGKQVVPAQWVENSWQLRAVSPISGQPYGLGWWIGELARHPVNYAWGFGGQYIFVVPDLEMVVVTTSSDNPGDTRREHRMALWDLVERQVIGAL